MEEKTDYTKGGLLVNEDLKRLEDKFKKGGKIESFYDPASGFFKVIVKEHESINKPN